MRRYLAVDQRVDERAGDTNDSRPHAHQDLARGTAHRVEEERGRAFDEDDTVELPLPSLPPSPQLELAGRTEPRELWLLLYASLLLEQAAVRSAGSAEPAAWLSALLLAKPIEATLVDQGVREEVALDSALALGCLLEGRALPAGASAAELRAWLGEESVRLALHAHRFGDANWIEQEAYERLLDLGALARVRPLGLEAPAALAVLSEVAALRRLGVECEWQLEALSGLEPRRAGAEAGPDGEVSDSLAPGVGHSS